MRKSISVIAAAVMAISAVSCMKDDTIQYNNITMGNVVNGAYVSDQGNTFNIVEQTCVGKIDTMQRALTVCDILTRTEGGQENEYDVRVNMMLEVLVKDIVAAGTELGEDMKAEHLIDIDKVWISGGYINMAVLFPYNPANKAKHMVNLIQQESAEAGTYAFRLTHNAYEDEIKDNDTAGYQISGGYVSFPLNSLIKEDEAKILISWKSFDIMFQPLEEKIEGTYIKDGFEQTPLITSAATRVAIR